MDEINEGVSQRLNRGSATDRDSDFAIRKDFPVAACDWYFF